MLETPQYRPALHFTARDTWLNDPNGLILHKGTYHLFFQNNPTGRTWGNIGWGHAVSKDLTQWEELPIAIPAVGEEMAFSGSAVWDIDNTSGLGVDGEGPLVAFFTSAYSDAHPTCPGRQAQSLAYSNDDGRTWTRFEGNPVLDRDSTDFRDPQVFWHAPTGRWVMVTVEAVDRQVLIFTSPNLRDWTHRSSFGPIGEEGILWECPDLFEVPLEGTHHSRWVLLLSTNPGGWSGGSGMRYWVGDFDGAKFAPDEHGARCLDHGHDLYAAVSFQGVERPTVVGWMSNWDYANQTPTFPWQSAMSLPRTLTLVPTPGGDVLRHVWSLPDKLPAGVNRSEFEFHGAGEVAIVTGAGPDASRFVLRRLSDGSIVADRSAADPHGVHHKLPTTRPIPTPPGPLAGVLIEDHGLIEVLLADGTISITVQTFPATGNVTLHATGEAALSRLDQKDG